MLQTFPLDFSLPTHDQCSVITVTKWPEFSHWMQSCKSHTDSGHVHSSAQWRSFCCCKQFKITTWAIYWQNVGSFFSPYFRLSEHVKGESMETFCCVRSYDTILPETSHKHKHAFLHLLTWGWPHVLPLMLSNLNNPTSGASSVMQTFFTLLSSTSMSFISELKSSVNNKSRRLTWKVIGRSLPSTSICRTKIIYLQEWKEIETETLPFSTHTFCEYTHILCVQLQRSAKPYEPPFHPAQGNFTASHRLRRNRPKYNWLHWFWYW